MIGEIIKGKSPLSSWQPSQDIVEVTQFAQNVYNDGYTILHKDHEELNHYSVIDRMNKDQRTFNSYVDESIEDSREAWKWRGTRSIARNRGLAMHAHMTASLAIPMAFAQNDRQEEDREFSNVMRDILEWMAVNSNYKQAYTLVTMGALVNPVTYLTADYVEVFQTVKARLEEGVETKEILDEVLSGFQAEVLSANQVLISNAHEQNIQRQRAIIKRRYIDYHEARARWEQHPNWPFVNKGIKSIYNEEDGLFYEIFDEEAHKNLVEEVCLQVRREDTGIYFLNGIYMGNENVDDNPIRHRDNRDAPKYNVIPFGYERINEHFFYYKSLMNRVGWDSNLIDAMYENTMNRELQDVDPALSITGAEDFDTQFVAPGTLFVSENPEFEAKRIIPPNRVSGYQALREIEKSISEETVSEVQTGGLPEAEQKASTVARAEQNARTVLRGAFRATAESMAQYGQLMIDIALQHLTTAQLDEITGGIKYRNFFLSDQLVDGRKVGKNIIFDEAMIGRDLSKEERSDRLMGILEETDFPNNKNFLYRINPHLFSKFDYLSRIEVDVMIEKNSAHEASVAEKLYNSLREDPLVSAEALVRNLLNAEVHGRADDFMSKQLNVEQIMNSEGDVPRNIPNIPKVENKTAV